MGFRSRFLQLNSRRCLIQATDALSCLWAVYLSLVTKNGTFSDYTPNSKYIMGKTYYELIYNYFNFILDFFPHPPVYANYSTLRNAAMTPPKAMNPGNCGKYPKIIKGGIPTGKALYRMDVRIHLPRESLMLPDRKSPKEC